MRLTCPNCDAQYEVPESAIPAGGRDVQCSNCGHFWYQLPVGSEDDALADDDAFAPPAAPPAAEDDEDVISPAAPEAEPAPLSPEAEEALTSALADAPPQAPEPEPEPEPAPEEDDAPPAAPAPAARPKSLDESLVALLKEEAEREVEARRQEAARAANLMPETQGDLGLPQPDEGAERARRLAELQGEAPAAPEAEPEAAAAPARLPARRDLLPDVEAITSTLHGSEAEARQAEAEVAALPDLTRQRGGFRSGFSLVMLLLILGIAAYLAAPQLKAQFPAAAASVDAYVKAVNDGRAWLDDMMNRATSAISGSSGT